MKRFAYLLAIVAVLGMASASYADLDSAAVARVYATVNPNVAVNYEGAAVDLGTFQTGEIEGLVTFRVDANKESLCLFVEASDLYKGDDPTNMDVPPIPLDLEQGVELDPVNANPLGGGSPVASFDTTGDVVEGFPTQLSSTVCFESSQNGHFSQNVDVILYWLQDDPEKPMGEYSGVVRLTAFIIDDVNGGGTL